MKKKILSILLALGLVFSLCACGGPTPTSTVETFLDAVKVQDTETIKTVYGDEDFSFIGEMDLESEDSTQPETDKILNEKLLPKLLEFDYTVSNEQINEDKATVDVTVTTYNFGPAMTSFFSSYMTQAFALIFDDNAEAKLDKIAANLLTAEVDKLTEKTCEKTATISLTATEEGWVIDEIDEEGEVLDALTGGMVSSIEALNEAFE